MNIRTIQCPSCGSNLNVESVNQSLIYCMYCGASVQVETNHNKGYDMELGRIEARAEMADKLLAKIEKIKPVLIRNSIAQSQKRNYPNEIYRLEGELSDMRFGGLKPYVLKPFLIGLGVLFGGALVVVIASSIVPKPVLYILEFLVGGAPIYLPVLGFLLKLKIEADISRDIKDGKDKLAEIEREYEETEAYIKTNAEVDIPPRFRHEPALNYIVKGLKAREFITLEQALFKCEEAMTRREIPDSYVPL